jgi:hypothetical protein
MKIKINEEEFIFHRKANLKVCFNYLSITEPNFIEENSQRSEFCNNPKIVLPRNIAKIFLTNRKIISVLFVDLNRKKKIVCHPARS